MTNFTTACLSAGIFSQIGSILIALLVLLFMITVHEFGHYIVAKAFNFKVNEFAIGMGPAFYKKQKANGEIFSLRALPLGGFCAFEGEDEDNKDPRAFNNRPPYQRILVLIAGATMNFITAIIIFCISISCYGQMCMQAFEVIQTDSAYTLQNEDVILSLNKKDIYLTTDLVSALKGKKMGDEVPAVVLRDGEKQNITIKLLSDPTSESMEDLSGVYQSLGIATLSAVTESVNNSNLNSLLKGDYILRISDTAPTLYDPETTDKSGMTDCKSWNGHDMQLYLIDEGEYMSQQRTYTPEDFANAIKEFNDGDFMYLYISRGEDRIVLEYQLDNVNSIKEDNNAIFNYFGITMQNVGYRLYSQNVKFGLFESFGRGVVYAVKNVSSTLSAFWQLITGRLSLNAIGGPVTTISLTSQYVSMGFNYLLEIAGFIGVSLAVFNLLPIPALDGARAIFVIIEWIRKKPINRNVEGTIHAVGLILLLVFAVTIDLVKCF